MVVVLGASSRFGLHQRTLKEAESIGSSDSAAQLSDGDRLDISHRGVEGLVGRPCEI